MASFHIVLRHLTIVLDTLLFKNAHRVGFLQERISDVLLIGEDLTDIADFPFFISGAVQNAVCLKSPLDLKKARAVHVLGINSFDNFCLFRDNDQLAIFILGVSEKAVMVDLNLALLVPELDAEADVCRQGFRFLLGQCRHDRHEHFALCIQSVDVLFFKENGNIQRFELSCVFQAVNRVSGESADGLGQDHVDLAGLAVIDHTVELVSLFSVGAADTVVRIYLDKFPFRLALDVGCVVLDLNVVAGFLFFIFSRYTAVGSHPCFLDFGFRLLRSDFPYRRNDRNILC